MKSILLFILTVLLAISCGTSVKRPTPMASDNVSKVPFDSGYALVNGLNMYYEIYGEGNPLVLIHGGGSTIQSTFGRVIPLLAKNHKLIAVELQAHGRTGDRKTALSFTQDADDIAALLQFLEIPKADIFGFSNGGTTALEMGIRHPGMVGKIVAASPLAKRNGAPDWFWQVMSKAKLQNMPAQLRTAYLEVNPDSAGLQNMHDKDAERMINFTDIPDEQLEGIQSPVFIIIADNDVILEEHGKELVNLIPDSKLLIVPGMHGSYIGEITSFKPGTKTSDYVIPQIEEFLGD